MGQNYPRIEAVRSEDWKYIRYYSKENDQHHLLSLIAPILGEKAVYEELYDLKRDAKERNNLAGNPKYQDVLTRHRKRCDELLLEAKGDSELPMTHLEGDEDPALMKKAKKRYKKLEAKF